MASVVEAGCYIEKIGNNEYRLRPRTGLDSSLIDSYLDNRGRYSIIRLCNKAQPKSYDQTKAFHALAALHFQLFNGHSPTTQEMEWWKNDCLEPLLFPSRPDMAHEGQMVHKRWHELTKSEGIEVISKMLQLVAEQIDIPDNIAADCKDIFEWVQSQRSEMKLEEESKPLEDIAKDLDEMEIF